MKRLFLALCFLSFALPASAEFKWEHIGLGNWGWEDISWKSISDLEGWTPRYSYVEDDDLIGRTHYLGMSFFKRQGAAHEGLTFRSGLGNYGEKINLAFSSGFSMVGVDFGLSYYILNKDNPRQHDNEFEGIALELGLRFWVVQIHAIHQDDHSFVNLAYGF